MRLSEIQGVLRDNMDASEVLFRKCPSLCEAWKDSVLSGQIWASAFGLATPVLVEDGRRDAASLEPAESQECFRGSIHTSGHTAHSVRHLRPNPAAAPVSTSGATST
jgi:hypothetical protein